jgi:hypothetical protein
MDKTSRGNEEQIDRAPIFPSRYLLALRLGTLHSSFPIVRKHD